MFVNGVVAQQVARLIALVATSAALRELPGVSLDRLHDNVAGSAYSNEHSYALTTTCT